MNSSHPNAGPEPAAAPEERTGLPGLRTWRGVYFFVLGCFVLSVLLLLALTLGYS